MLYFGIQCVSVLIIVYIKLNNMESQLGDIECKLSDYKICKKCGAINWYKNEKCVCNHTKFNESEDAVIEWLELEYKFWEDDGYTRADADMIYIDV